MQNTNTRIDNLLSLTNLSQRKIDTKKNIDNLLSMPLDYVDVDERLEKGDIVVLVARLGESEYNGKIYQSNTGERFLKVGHEEHAPAFRNDVREAEKINPADYGY